MMNKLQTKFRKMQNKKGFTLIELIVVIVIIGILAAIIVPRLSGFQESATNAAIEADQRTIETAVAVYYAEENDYPEDVAALVTAGYLNEAPSSATFEIADDGTVSVAAAAEE